MTHLALGWCVWDLPALIIVVAVIAVLCVYRGKLKKREKELNEELARKNIGAVAGTALRK